MNQTTTSISAIGQRLQEAAKRWDEWRHSAKNPYYANMDLYRSDTALLSDYAVGQMEELKRLKAAIKKHHDQKADDRCWMDDVELYLAAGLEVPEGMNCVGDPEAMRKNCDKFIEHRCKAGGPWPTYQELLDFRKEGERMWAEAIANGWQTFDLVPEPLKPGVKELLDELLDPNAPVPPVAMHNMVHRKES